MGNRMVRRAGILGIVCCIVGNVTGEDWARWRGPGGFGVSPAADIPLRWSPTENIAWKLDIPPLGNSSPVIVGDRIYVTTQTKDTSYHVLAVDRGAGKLLWQQTVGKGKLKTHPLHNMASPSCVADAERAWALFGTGDLVCLDAEGKELWKRNMQKEHGKYVIKWGMGSSLVLHGGMVYVVCMHTGQSYVLALDGKTGRQVWKDKRDFPAEQEGQDAYTTPIIVGEGDGARLVVSGADHVNAYNPADGTEIWRCAGLKVPHHCGRSISSPTFSDGVIVAVASGFRSKGHTMAIKAGGKGDITKTHRMWVHEDHSPDCATPVCWEGLMYMNNDRGEATCLDLKTGEVKWQKKLLSGDCKVSPIAAAGRVYFFNNKTVCKVVKAGPEGEVLAENSLEGTMMATPAVCDGKLYFRTHDRLYAVGR